MKASARRRPVSGQLPTFASALPGSASAAAHASASGRCAGDNPAASARTSAVSRCAAASSMRRQRSSSVSLPLRCNQAITASHAGGSDFGESHNDSASVASAGVSRSARRAST